MEKSAFGKLGRDGFNSILLRMDPLEVVKLCWLTNMHLCDNVGWSHLLQKGFKVLPEDIPDSTEEQRRMFYELATVNWIPLYVDADPVKYVTFRGDYDESIRLRKMPSRMKFREFVPLKGFWERMEESPMHLPYYNYSFDSREEDRLISPEGEKVWCSWTMSPGWSPVALHCSKWDSLGEDIRKALRIDDMMEALNLGDPKDYDAHGWDKIVICAYSALRAFDESIFGGGDIQIDVFRGLYEEGSYVQTIREYDSIFIHQVGEVEFLPIWK